MEKVTVVGKGDEYRSRTFQAESQQQTMGVQLWGCILDSPRMISTFHLTCHL